MAEHYSNTVFDENWQPYDVLENILAEAESEIKQTEEQILDPATPITSSLRRKFCWGLAVSVCRLPHVMDRGHRRRIDLAYALAEIHQLERVAFEDGLASFGQKLTDAGYNALKATHEDELIGQATYLAELSPQNPDFPRQDALEGINPITEVFNRMDIEILESNRSPFFIIGDTPIPDSELAMGFIVPLAKIAAARFQPTNLMPTFSRRAATSMEIAAINKEQYDNSATHVVGPDPAYLDALVS